MPDRNPLHMLEGATVSPRCELCTHRLAFMFAEQRWMCVNRECEKDRDE